MKNFDGNFLRIESMCDDSTLCVIMKIREKRDIFVIKYQKDQTVYSCIRFRLKNMRRKFNESILLK